MNDPYPPISKQFEDDLVELKIKYPMVFITALTPDDFVGMDSTLPANWDAPVHKSIRDTVDTNFDMDVGTSMEDIAAMIPDAVVNVDEVRPEEEPKMKGYKVGVLRTGYSTSDINVIAPTPEAAFHAALMQAANYEFSHDYHAEYSVNGIYDVAAAAHIAVQPEWGVEPGSLTQSEVWEQFMDQIVKYLMSLRSCVSISSFELVKNSIMNLLDMIFRGTNTLPPFLLAPLADRYRDVILDAGKSWPRNHDLLANDAARGILHGHLHLHELFMAALTRWDLAHPPTPVKS